MRAVIQRVSRARVVVEEKITGAIESGVVALIGVGCEDTPAEAVYIADKIAHLRIFEDDQGKMNRSLLESGGAALVISQFTLYGDVRRGRRPGFDQAATHEQAEALYEDCLRALRSHGVRVETGVFRAQMSVELTNEGPVTILVDSAKLF